MNASTQTLQSQAGSPLRQRMIEDMRMRMRCDKPQIHHIRAVRRFAQYLGRSPDTASVEDLSNFQLHLVDEGISPPTLNATITGLRFFFEVTLSNAALMAKMKAVQVPRTLPAIKSREEVARLLPIEPLSTRQLNRAVHTAALDAGIDKRVSMHTLRYYLPYLTMLSLLA